MAVARDYGYDIQRKAQLGKVSAIRVGFVSAMGELIRESVFAHRDARRYFSSFCFRPVTDAGKDKRYRALIESVGKDSVRFPRYNNRTPSQVTARYLIG